MVKVRLHECYPQTREDFMQVVSESHFAETAADTAHWIGEILSFVKNTLRLSRNQNVMINLNSHNKNYE